ncbi:uncharacterized protein LOC120924238, partial [Rana temporaria]|uniref:uncharacterized protein LOC120924238 n=1 Tax=Rana temporaria TaxID=8407 RepID=UPI001AAD7022
MTTIPMMLRRGAWLGAGCGAVPMYQSHLYYVLLPGYRGMETLPADMEVQLMEHIRHTLTLDRNKDLIIEKLLSLTLEIIHLLTTEDFVVVRKSRDHLKDGSIPSVPDRGSEAASPMAESLSGAEDGSFHQMDLQPTVTSQKETKKVLIKHEEVPSLSLKEWDHSGFHKEDSDLDTPQTPRSVGDGNEKTVESCESAPYPRDCMAEDNHVMAQGYQVQAEDIWYTVFLDFC